MTGRLIAVSLLALAATMMVAMCGTDETGSCGHRRQADFADTPVCRIVQRCCMPVGVNGGVCDSIRSQCAAMVMKCWVAGQP